MSRIDAAWCMLSGVFLAIGVRHVSSGAWEGLATIAIALVLLFSASRGAK